MLPKKENMTICFAHVAYQLGNRFAARNPGINHFHVWKGEDLLARVGEADVLVISGLWRNEILDKAKKVQFIQSIGAGTEQFPKDKLKERGIRLASASGVNKNAVSEHAMSLLLALARRLPEARDNQHQHVWRGMISDLNQREDELGGKTLIVIGLGAIGSRLAKLAKAFGMKVIGVKRDPSNGGKEADSVHSLKELPTLLPQADFVALTCALTPETAKVINASTLAVMKPSAYLINTARGGCVDEDALIAALKQKKLGGAALDVTVEEPLPASSPLWDTDGVFITPHTAGETRKYEDNVLDILTENLDRLWRGETALRNQII